MLSKNIPFDESVGESHAVDADPEGLRHQALLSPVWFFYSP